MRDLEYYAKLCMAQLDALHIHYAERITFQVNTRAVSRLGICRKSGDCYVIEIAAALLDERVPLRDGLLDTLMHELLHTCYGCMKHTGRWKQYADKVNAAYGYHIKRAAAREEHIVPKELEKPPKYKVICPNCGMEYERYKMSEFIRHPEKYRCGKCGKSMKSAERRMRKQ